MGNNVLMDTLRSDPKYGNLFETTYLQHTKQGFQP